MLSANLCFQKTIIPTTEILKEALKLGINRKPNLIEIEELQVSESIQLCALKLIRPLKNIYVYENIVYFQSI